MKIIKTEDRIINVPESWEEVTIKQQLHFETLHHEEQDYKSLTQIAGYCGMTVEEVKHLPFNITKDILSVITAFSLTPIENKVITEFQYKGDTYSILDTLLKGQTQDFISLMTLYQNFKDRENLALPYVVSILAKKQLPNGKTESLTDIDVDQRAKHFEDLPITIASNCQFFFAVNATLSTIDYRKVLQDQDQKLMGLINSMLTTTDNYPGGHWYTKSAMKISRNYLKFLKANWKRFYSGTLSKAGKPD